MNNLRPIYELRYADTGRLIQPYSCSMTESLGQACHVLAYTDAVRNQRTRINVVTGSGEVVAKLELGIVWVWDKEGVQWVEWIKTKKRNAS